ncbi:MAG: glycine--tRNA ligase [Rickettsiales bacterium]|jgi:glycyl-tRNA synthetase|nr:glycine--tRNA ligase [Rickettsiales bacterium]
MLKNMEDLVSFCKKRGFVFQGSEIYGGLKGTYDLGPLGIELKKNLRNSWWRTMVYERDDVEGLEASLLSHRTVWKYSGHEDGFSDPLVECKKCHARMRQDKMKDTTKCDYCGSSDLTEPRNFLLMMKTNVGPIEDGENFAYLRAETAQGTYLNFKNVLNSTSRKLPFGIAQHGKSFRNEITPRNFLFRQREFEQAEMQFFINPKDDEKWFEEWKNIRLKWWVDNGIARENLGLHPHDELAHYAKAAVDIEYKFPWGFDEVEGIHNRQDFDLGSHTKNQNEFKINAKVKKNTESTEKLSYRDAETGEEFLPFVIETAIGLDRAMIAFLSEAYTEETLENGESRVVLKLHKNLAPIKVAIMPLAKNNPQIVKVAHEIKSKLLALGLGRIVYENTGNIGKAYRRNDEVGTPLCITVDFETLEKSPASVTIRDRDTMQQVRINVDEIEKYITDFYKN